MIDFKNANEMFIIYGVYPRDGGHVESQILGRIAVLDGKLTIIEDHWKLGQMLKEGPVEGDNERVLNGLQHSSYARIAAEGELHEGKHLDLVKPRAFGGVARQYRDGIHTDAPPDAVEQADTTQTAPQSIEPTSPPPFTMNPPPAIFDYLRVGMKEPSIVEVHGQDVYMNGNKLSPEQAHRLLETVKQGLATLRYRRAV